MLRQDGSATLVPGSTEPADVTLVEDWSTAEAIVSGSRSLPDLLTAGKIKLRGNSNALVSAGDLLARIAPLIAAALEEGGAQDAPVSFGRWTMCSPLETASC